MKRKKTWMLTLLVIVLLIVSYVSLPYYTRQALVYRMPVIDDLETFHRVYESYRDGWDDTRTSNIYFATKTIVSMLMGIALDKSKIHSLDNPVSRYIPIYNKGKQADVTIRYLPTMSGA